MSQRQGCAAVSAPVLLLPVSQLSQLFQNQVSRHPQDLAVQTLMEEKACGQSHAPTQGSKESATLLAISDFQRLPLETPRQKTQLF